MNKEEILLELQKCRYTSNPNFDSAYSHSRLNMIIRFINNNKISLVWTNAEQTKEREEFAVIKLEQIYDFAMLLRCLGIGF